MDKPSIDWNLLLVDDHENEYLNLRSLLSPNNGIPIELHWTRFACDAIQRAPNRPYQIFFVDFRPFTLEDLAVLEVLEKKSPSAKVIFLRQPGTHGALPAINSLLRKGACDLLDWTFLTRGGLWTALDQAFKGIQGSPFSVPLSPMVKISRNQPHWSHRPVIPLPLHRRQAKELPSGSNGRR